MSDYRESCNEAKAVRRGIVVPRPVGGRKKRQAQNVVVEIRYPYLRWYPGWSKFGAYPDLETANQVIANKTRGGSQGIEYRIKP